MALTNKYYQQGLDYYKKGNLDNAITFFKCALDEECYRAAYRLGLCYFDMGDIDQAIKYMEIGFKNWVDVATQWLAKHYYYEDQLVYSLDYAVCIPEYLEANSNQYIKKLKDYYEELDKGSYQSLFVFIDDLEYWWKSIKNNESKIKHVISKMRNDSVDILCSLLVAYSSDDKTREEIKSFLNNDKYLKLKGVADSIITSDYVAALDDIKRSSTAEELDKIEDRCACIADQLLSANLKQQISDKRAFLIVGKNNISNQEFEYIKECMKNAPNNSYNAINSCIAYNIDEALSISDYNRARSLCDFFDNSSALKIKYLATLERSTNKRSEYNKPIYKPLEPKEMYFQSRSQVAFMQYFNHLWANKKEDDIIALLVDAKKYHLDFKHIRNKCGDDFLKRFLYKLPPSFFNEDVARIKNSIAERKITKLIHFTPYPNAPSILANGLYSKDELAKRKMKGFYTDDSRFDGYTDYISLSITRANIGMFWNKMYNSSAMKYGAEIFEINPAILYEHPECVVYCSCNAARSDAAAHRNFGIDGFNDMFEDDDWFSWKASNLPVDEQAEILFKGHIDKKYILKHYTKRFNDGKESSVYSRR